MTLHTTFTCPVAGIWIWFSTDTQIKVLNAFLLIEVSPDHGRPAGVHPSSQWALVYRQGRKAHKRIYTLTHTSKDSLQVS